MYLRLTGVSWSSAMLGLLVKIKLNIMFTTVFPYLTPKQRLLDKTISQYIFVLCLTVWPGQQVIVDTTVE